MKKDKKQVMFRLDDEEVEKLDLACRRLGLDRNSYLKLIINGAHVDVRIVGEGDSKVIAKEEKKGEGRPAGMEEYKPAGPKAEVLEGLKKEVEGIMNKEYKRGDIFVKNEGYEEMERLRRATVAFCFKNEIEDESLLNKGQKEFIKKNMASLLGEDFNPAEHVWADDRFLKGKR